MSVGTQSAPIVVSSATAGGGDTDAGAMSIRAFREFRLYSYRYTGTINELCDCADHPRCADFGLEGAL